jgi:prepilin-type processing-associated H-X9-DG protein
VPLGYAMSCDYNWGWKGYSYRGSQSCLFEQDVAEPAGTIFMADCTTSGGHRVCPPQRLMPQHWTGTPGWEGNHRDIEVYGGLNAAGRHTGGANYIFFDGHAKWYKVEATVTPRNLWTIVATD